MPFTYTIAILHWRFTVSSSSLHRNAKCRPHTLTRMRSGPSAYRLTYFSFTLFIFFFFFSRFILRYHYVRVEVYAVYAVSKSLHKYTRIAEPTNAKHMEKQCINHVEVSAMTSHCILFTIAVVVEEESSQPICWPQLELTSHTLPKRQCSSST